jgi:hypothetical protein
VSIRQLGDQELDRRRRRDGGSRFAKDLLDYVPIGSRNGERDGFRAMELTRSVDEGARESRQACLSGLGHYLVSRKPTDIVVMHNSKMSRNERFLVLGSTAIALLMGEASVRWLRPERYRLHQTHRHVHDRASASEAFDPRSVGC